MTAKVIIVDTDHLWGIGGDCQWVWKSFTRGLNPIFMDCYAPYYFDGKDPNNSTWVNVRQNMGHILSYANRMKLATMVPQSDLCSTEYCLADPIGEEAEYLVYLPDGGDVSVDLSGSLVELVVEWFNPENGTVVNTQEITGGDTQNFLRSFF